MCVCGVCVWCVCVCGMYSVCVVCMQCVCTVCVCVCMCVCVCGMYSYSVWCVQCVSACVCVWCEQCVHQYGCSMCVSGGSTCKSDTMLVPSSDTPPYVGIVSPLNIENSVLFPAPLCPSRPTHSLFFIANETLFTTERMSLQR